MRRGICKLPQKLKAFVCDVLAILLYMPFVLLCRVLRFFGAPEKVRSKLPLFGYEKVSFRIIRNDSLDRFGTQLEQRFSKKEIEMMMNEAGLRDIVFSDKIPFWHAVGRKK